MGLLSSIGGMLNDLTGATSAQESQNSFNYQMQKEFAQNGVQWKAKDLEKAGFNKALATGQGGTSASPVGYSAGGGGDIFGALSAIVGMDNQTNATNADVKLKNAQAVSIIEMLPLNKEEKQRIIRNLGLTGKNIQANTKYTNERARGYQWSGSASGSLGVGKMKFGSGNISASRTY